MAFRDVAPQQTENREGVEAAPFPYRKIWRCIGLC